MDDLKNIDYLRRLKLELLNEKKSLRYEEACLAYAARLLDNSLPVIFDKQHLALAIGMKLEDLTSFLVFDEKYLYKSIKIPKKMGGFREINVPIFDLKYIQRWILDNVLNHMKPSEHATGFIMNKSIVDNANIHVGARYLVNLDLCNFFPTIAFPTVFRLFYYYGYTKEVSYTFAKLCTHEGKLPQGSPASPAISNLVCLKLDKRLSRLALSFSINYSRYADDITFSGERDLNEFFPLVEKIINEEGFTLNSKKTRFAEKHQRQEITGLIINDGKPRVAKKYKRKLQQEIYFCRKFGVISHMERIGQTKRFYREHLYGKAYFIKMVEPEVGAEFLRDLDNLSWEGYL